jgi:hypothetical protein
MESNHDGWLRTMISISKEILNLDSLLLLNFNVASEWISNELKKACLPTLFNLRMFLISINLQLFNFLSFHLLLPCSYLISCNINTLVDENYRLGISHDSAQYKLWTHIFCSFVQNYVFTINSEYGHEQILLAQTTHPEHIIPAHWAIMKYS